MAKIATARIRPAIPGDPTPASAVQIRKPNNPRVHRAPWGLNRIPFDFRELSELGWVSKIDLGEQLPQYQGEQPLLEDLEDEPPPPTSSTTRRSTTASRAPPRTLSWSWALQSSGAIGTLAAITTPTIPWPFRIVGCSYEATPSGVPVNKQAELQIFAVDTAYSGIVPEIAGVALIPRIGIAGTQFGIRINSFTNAVASQQGLINNVATAVLGITVLDTNKRLCVGLKQTDAVTNSFQGHITIEEYQADQTVEVRSTAAPIARAAPAAPRATPAGASAAPALPGTKPPYGTLQYWLNQLAVLSRNPNKAAIAPKLADARRYIAYLQASGTANTAFGGGSGAKAQTAFVGGGQLGTRWTLDEYPGMSWATAAEASLYAQARGVANLPAGERAAAAEAVRRAASQLTYGPGEIPTPQNALLAPLPSGQRGSTGGGIVRSPGDPSWPISQGYTVTDKNFPGVLFRVGEVHDRYGGMRIPGYIA